MQKIPSPYEILIGKHHFLFDSNNILHVTPSGIVSYEDSVKIREVFISILDSTDGKVNVMVDLNYAGKPSLNARKVAKEIMSRDKIEKIAFVGMHSVAGVIASFMIKFLNKNEAQFFNTKQEALNWIQE